ncbi:uncharacterized protein [Argopecten irradians]|uniref:uncharacterized protein n=1 Tax=Argopecten irradians TaxID=31199 RepID=UPI003718C564
MMASTLVLGNSQARYFYQHIDANDQMHIISKSGLTFEKAWLQLRNIVSNYSILVLHLGFDEIAKRESDEVTLSKYQALVEKLWGIHPTLKIVISGIPPRGDNRFTNMIVKDSYIRSFNEEAKSVNTGLSSVSSLLPQLFFIGHGYFMTNGCLDRSLFGRDGVHFSMSGVRTVVNSIKLCVKYVSKQSDSIKVRDSVKKVKQSNSVKVRDIFKKDKQSDSIKVRDSVKKDKQSDSVKVRDIFKKDKQSDSIKEANHGKL